MHQWQELAVALRELRAALFFFQELPENAQERLKTAVHSVLQFAKLPLFLKKQLTAVFTIKGDLSAPPLLAGTLQELVCAIEECIDLANNEGQPSPASNAIPPLLQGSLVGAGAEPPTKFAEVCVFFATDRKKESSNKPAEIFSAQRSEKIHYGTCNVSIPHNHKMGELESPSIWRFEFRNDPKKHVVLLSVTERNKKDFFAQAAECAAEADADSAFIFIHGYNVTFEDAAKRTAQITYDLQFQGAPIFYSWPSHGRTTAYTKDEENVRWSQGNLKTFLDEFMKESAVRNIHIIAHSMGNRAVTGALCDLFKEKPESRKRIKELILTAPDIDADIFKRDIVPILTSPNASVTLYASSKDLALEASRKVHGHQRAGDSGKNIVICNGLETIDASDVTTDFLGHSYFAQAKSVITDIFELICNQRNGQRFWLNNVRTPQGEAYWKFTK